MGSFRTRSVIVFFVVVLLCSSSWLDVDVAEHLLFLEEQTHRGFSQRGK